MTASPVGSSTLPLPAAERTAAIVLVHGAWVGEWSPHVTRADHVDDVVGLIETLDLAVLMNSHPAEVATIILDA